MHLEIVQSLTLNFESFAQKTEEGLEFWFARDLQKLLGYAKWDNFRNVLEKAKESCAGANQSVEDHFPEVGKMVFIGSGAEKSVEDIALTRYACYLVAQNGDPKKDEIAFAQRYFALQTRKAELIEQSILEHERVRARKKLSKTEKELSEVIFEQTGSEKNFGIIRSKGDYALFRRTTQEMKNHWRISPKRPLADYMPTILLKAKDFATEITIFNARANHMETEQQISEEHTTNNTSVRETLISRGITPELLPVEEDVKKIERRLIHQEKGVLKNPSE